jgi:four helix bundle protein
MEKLKTEIGKPEMNLGRLPVEFRDRTKKFASAIIRLFVRLPRARDEVSVLGKQLLRSGTSVAAHVREASRARSEDEFVSKLGGALQEADESQLWLELLREECAIEPKLTQPLAGVFRVDRHIHDNDQSNQTKSPKVISVIDFLLSPLPFRSAFDFLLFAFKFCPDECRHSS